MIPAERQKKILNMIASNHIISINSLVEALGVSHMTIRRDIKALENIGQVVAISGGVQLIERLTTEPTHDDKSLLHPEEKAAIGKHAAKYCPAAGTIFLDAGTTTLEIARAIKDNDKLQVVTNDFEIARFLMRNGKCALLHTGGSVNKNSYSAVGELAANFIRNLSVDVAFISTSSWSYDGTTTPDEQKICVKHAITKSAHRKILVSDSSKYGKVATFTIDELNVFDQIITDSRLQKKSQSMIERKGIKIDLVEVDNL